MASPWTLTAFSTALFSSWCFLEEFGILLDCGDGATSSLLQKARKAKHCFISHADRDHLTGLLQFQQLNGRPDLRIYFPKDCGSLRALANFTTKFDPHITGTRWKEISDHARITVRNDLSVRSKVNAHVPGAENQIKSLSYFVEAQSKKLKSEFAGLPGKEIATLRKEHGEERLFDFHNTTLFCYSGDTPVIRDGRYANCGVLMHEATFLSRDELDSRASDRNIHSSLDSVMEMVRDDGTIGHLILSHFSSRYSEDEIRANVAREIRRCGLRIDVDIIPPGTTFRTQFS